MTTETLAATESVEQKINKLRELFADAPEVGKKALENVLSRLASDASQAPPPPVRERRPGRAAGWARSRS